ncbi:MAG: hypothetical protein ACKV2V_16260 [Blastocatellia bacterium]
MRILLTLSLLAMSALAQSTAPQTAPKTEATQTAAPKTAGPQKLPESLTAAECARLSRELSEEGGYFRSDNFTSNETSYLHIVDKLKQLAQKGGAYLGVGPEQNYTYIAKTRPQIVFLLDIRRQAIIQHLMYKAVFHHSPTRVEFLARLLSKPLPKEKPAATLSLNETLALVDKIPADEPTYTANLALIRKTIEDDFQFPLSAEDQKSLEYVYKSFRADGLSISYRMDSWQGSWFPTLKEILAETDLNGIQTGFLATVDDFEFMRGMHRKNLIIPVVGNFGGKKAIAAIGEYLRQRNTTVTAFYLSNVEQYLFGDGIFGAFAENVRRLPLSDKSLFIRAVAGRMPHPARINGHRLVTLMQSMKVFLDDYDKGLYGDYIALSMTNYIAAELPK